MHNEILNNNQIELLNLVKQFRREFYLVGGTAIALHLGHRQSIDFDLFKAHAFNSKKVLSKIEALSYRYQVTRRVQEQLNVNVNGVKLTFFEFPYSVPTDVVFDNVIKIPSLLNLAAMKAFALGRRSKWKDYVDIYFIIKDHYSIAEITSAAIDIFGDEFSEKLFRSQIAYHRDIDYSEQVDYVHGFEVDSDVVRGYLIESAMQI